MSLSSLSKSSTPSTHFSAMSRAFAAVISGERSHPPPVLHPVGGRAARHASQKSRPQPVQASHELTPYGQLKCGRVCGAWPRVEALDALGGDGGIDGGGGLVGVLGGAVG